MFANFFATKGCPLHVFDFNKNKDGKSMRKLLYDEKEAKGTNSE